jgi:hypothetical protein
MTKATVTGTEIDAGGNLLAGVQVTAALYPWRLCWSEETYGINPAGISTESASDGTWSLDLECTDSMTPVGMTYEISRFYNGAFLPPLWITVPAGGGDYLALVTSEPASVMPGQGPPGPQGGVGPIGPPGTTSVYDQYVPASVWTIAHNLGRYPSVTTVDSGGDTVYGDIDYLSANELTISFASAFGGVAYLN